MTSLTFSYFDTKALADVRLKNDQDIQMESHGMQQVNGNSLLTVTSTCEMAKSLQSLSHCFGMAAKTTFSPRAGISSVRV